MFGSYLELLYGHTFQRYIVYAQNQITHIFIYIRLQPFGFRSIGGQPRQPVALGVLCLVGVLCVYIYIFDGELWGKSI